MKRNLPSEIWNRACLLAEQKFLPGKPKDGDRTSVRLIEGNTAFRIELTYTRDRWIMSALEEEIL
jgi:hypothetical protein